MNEKEKNKMEEYVDWQVMDELLNHLNKEYPQHTELKERTAEGLLTMGYTLRQLGGMLIDEVRDNRINN